MRLILHVLNANEVYGEFRILKKQILVHILVNFVNNPFYNLFLLNSYSLFLCRRLSMYHLAARITIFLTSAIFLNLYILCISFQSGIIIS